MSIVTEEVEGDLSAGQVATSRWSFFPMQAIPRNAEALWNLVDTVYFAPIPPGHEIIECLTKSRAHSESNKGAGGFSLTNCTGVSTLRLTYRLEGSEDIVSPSNPSREEVSLHFHLEEGKPGLLYSSRHLPLLAPSMKAAKLKNVDPPGEPEWTCVDSQLDVAMDTADEIGYTRFLLAEVVERKNRIITEVLSRIEQDQRPNRKHWFDCEQALLTLFERKPPSSYQPSALVTAPTSPSPHQLGRVAPELTDEGELCCSVCLEGDTTEENEILICDGCSFATHQNCYFVKEIPDGDWFCQLCQMGRRGRGSAAGSKSALLESTTCCLCLQSANVEGGGVMKPVEGKASTWAHVKCATWVPEAAFPAHGTSISVIANRDREELRCTVCKQKGGCPLQCAFGKCTVAFHVSCAAQSGLLPEEKSLKNLFCARHVKIQLKTSPTASRLLSLRKQDFYQKVMADKLVAPKIGNALFTQSFSPKEDARQAFILQILGSHPAMQRESAVSAVAEDLLEECPLVRDLALQTSSSFNQSIFAKLDCCCECMRPFVEGDAKFSCPTCQLQAHLFCYQRAGCPYPNAEVLSGAWLKVLGGLGGGVGGVVGATNSIIPSTSCLRCTLVGPTGLASSFCLLCLQLGGVMYPVLDEEDAISGITRGFIHPRCLWWFLSTNSVSLTTPPPAQLRGAISAVYHFHPCAVCGSRLGCTLRCSRQGCERRFHVSCGFHAGCYFSVRSAAGGAIVAGIRDEEDEEEVLKQFAQIAKGSAGMRRIVTCWHHEQRGVRGAKGGLSGFPAIRPPQLIRWVPDGIKPDLVAVVNQVLSGELGGEVRAGKKNIAEKPPQRPGLPRGRPKKIKEEETTRKRGRRSVQTVRFVDGEEILCEDEEWEGGCSLCGKAWLDDRGQTLESICCDECDEWFHFHCVGIDQAPPGSFACPKCAIII